MVLLGISECVSLTWTRAGDCRGVLLRRGQGGTRVVRHWQDRAPEGTGVGQVLRHALRHLDGRRNCILVAGSADVCAGSADLEYPTLPERELRNSLQYELAYHTPVQEDKVVWGYRVLQRADAQQRLRLYYMRESEWHRWLDELGALGRGVDAVLPPTLCFDPVLRGKSCFITATENGADGYLFRAGPDGERVVEWTEEPPEDAVGTGDTPLSGLDAFKPGSLEGLSADEQRSYLPAILLGLYAMSSALHTDSNTRIPLPYELRPVRNRYSRLFAVALLLCLVTLAGYAGWKEYTAAKAYQDELRARIGDIESWAQNRGGGDEDSRYDTLMAELRDVAVPRVSFAASLQELTQITPDTLWVQSLSWKDGRLDVQFATEETDTGILRTVEDSELFSGVSPQGTKIDRNGLRTIRLRMYASLPEETEDDVRRRSERRPVGDGEAEGDGGAESSPEDAGGDEGADQQAAKGASEDRASQNSEKAGEEAARREAVPAPPPPPPMPTTPKNSATTKSASEAVKDGGGTQDNTGNSGSDDATKAAPAPQKEPRR